MDQATREQLKSQYPNLTLAPITSDADGIEIVVSGAPPAVWTKYQAMTRDFADAAKRAQADEFLVLSSMVYPDKDQFRKQLEERRLTGFYARAASYVATLTGARDSIKLGEPL